MEIGTFISFSNSFCSLRNIYFKFCFENPYEEEVILLRCQLVVFHYSTWNKQWEAAI